MSNLWKLRFLAVLGLLTCSLLFALSQNPATEKPTDQKAPGEKNQQAEAIYGNTPEDLKPFAKYVKEPYKNYWVPSDSPVMFWGPGRDKPEPEVETVKIGVIAPISRSYEAYIGQSVLHGMQLALDDANAAGGYKGKRFEVVLKNDTGLWGASANEVVSLSYDDKVWAIIGTVDGANTHIAIRVSLKIEIPWMTPGDPDPTYIETNIPWVFRCIGDDRQQNYLLVDYLFRKLNYQRVAILRASNRYGRFGVREIRDGARRLNHPIVIEMAHKVGATDFTMHLDRIEAAQPEAIVYWGDAVDAANALNAIRARGLKQPVYFCDRVVSDEFVKLAGPNAEGVICTYPWDPNRSDPKLDTFRDAFKKRWGVEPDTYAAHAYDGINMIIWAIQTAGLNRARIRDVLAYRPDPIPGVTGDVPLSSALDDGGDVFLACREQSRWVFHSREDLEIPRGKVIEKPRAERQQASVE